MDASSSAMLRSLREYNRDDCESTRELADWLWAQRSARNPNGDLALVSGNEDAHGTESVSSPSPQIGDGRRVEATPSESDEESEITRLEEILLGRDSAWPVCSVLSEPAVRQTLAGMLRYHKREAKPQWWRRYEWLSSSVADLIADSRTIGGLVSQPLP